MPDLSYIQFLNGPRMNEKIPLEHFPVTFGRTNDSTVTINWDGLVSSRHFEIFLDEDVLFLRDSGSRNGTKINGAAVLRQRLHSSDIIEVGNSRLQITITPTQAIADIPQVTSANPSAKSLVSSRPSVSSHKRINPFESGFHDEFVQPSQSNAMAQPPTIQQVRLSISEQSTSSFNSRPGHKILWLSPGQSIVIGRSPRCDYSIEADSFMSSTHFKVSCELQQCLIEDLGSKSGTMLNDVAISQDSLFHGDRILAGKTEFLIEVDGNEGPILRTEKADGAKVNVAPVELLVPLKQPLSLTREKCPSGVFVLKGILQDQLPLETLVSWIRSLGKVYLLVDSTRGSIPLPTEYDAVSGQLFYWLPPELAACSPQLVMLEELPDWKSNMNDLIGNDGLVVLQSEASKADLLTALKTCLAGNPVSRKPFKGILGVCWPSVMSATIQSQSEDLFNRLLKDVSLVITEENEGKSYQLFASQSEKIDTLLGLLDRRQIKYSINRSDDIK